jgi:penicillin-binding protein 2
MTLQDDINVSSKRRVLHTVTAIIFLIFVARLYQLQLIYRVEYGRKSDENSIRTVQHDPVRGNMYDRNGILVVDNRPAFTVTIMPYEFNTREIPYLGSILDLDPAFIRDRLKKGEQTSRFQPVKIRRDIDFRALSAIEEDRDRLPGVDYQVESKRDYPTNARASHLLGYAKEISESQLKSLSDEYVPGDVIGSAGLEAEYESALRGEKGAELSTVNARGQIVGRFDNGKSDIPSVAGEDLYLTLDIGLQAFAESLMTDKRGSVVAIDPNDGGILAMVSSPDYDLNLFSGSISPRTWRRLNNDPAHPLFNRATLSRYPPGSTFKMILALAALEDSVVSPSWHVTCTGAFAYGNKVFRDLHVHGTVNMEDAIKVSCNVYFYQLMLKVGLDRWSEMGSRFGFGRLTGVDINEENPGLLPTTQFMNRRYGPRGWTRGFLPSLGIGQGEVGVTPLQMALYAMALANKGYYHTPHTVRATFDKTTNRIDTLVFPTRVIQIRPEHWRIVREGMRRAVMEPGGTGGAARIKGIEVAGKTGTAQNPHGKDHAWFVGFAPYDHPRIAICVLIENAGFGGTAAAPVAGMCMERYLFGRLIRPTGLPHPAVAQRSTPADSTKPAAH